MTTHPVPPRIKSSGNAQIPMMLALLRALLASASLPRLLALSEREPDP